MLLRMRGGMLERVKQGYWMGGGNLPYCYTYSKDTGTLIPIPERKEQANKAMDLFLQGYSDVKIRDMLGFKSEFVVKQVLTSPVNIGMIPYKGISIRDCMNLYLIRKCLKKPNNSEQ